MRKIRVVTPDVTGASADFNFINWVLPGVLVFNALAFGLITSSSLMLTMRELGVLRRQCLDRRIPDREKLVR